MIKYPVRIREVDTTYENRMGGWHVLNSDGAVICTQSERSDAITICNALNAINEVPRLRYQPELMTFQDWCKKFKLADWR